MTIETDDVTSGRKGVDPDRPDGRLRGEWVKLIVNGRDPFIQNSDGEKWSTSKGGPVFSKLFQLDQTDPLSFGPTFPEILLEWIAPNVLGLACC